MSGVVEIPITGWDQSCPPATQEQALRALEEGNVLFFPRLAFPIEDISAQIFSAATAGKSKNVSLELATGSLSGSRMREPERGPLHATMERFAASGKALLLRLLPHYEEGLAPLRVSFRPVEIEGRPTSWRKDDTRLHIDSFPSSPVQGRRILRIFSNVNPHGENRSWRIGESFEAVARRYLPALSGPAWGSSRLLHLCGLTKSRRSPYDHFMLQLHDRMKADLAYQSAAKQRACDFPPGSSWIAFTDQVSHAAMGGQFLLEQTFLLPVASMSDPAKSPLRILERLTGRSLT